MRQRALEKFYATQTGHLWFGRLFRWAKIFPIGFIVFIIPFWESVENANFGRSGAAILCIFGAWAIVTIILGVWLPWAVAVCASPDINLFRTAPSLPVVGRDIWRIELRMCFRKVSWHAFPFVAALSAFVLRVEEFEPHPDTLVGLCVGIVCYVLVEYTFFFLYARCALTFRHPWQRIAVAAAILFLYGLLAGLLCGVLFGWLRIFDLSGLRFIKDDYFHMSRLVFLAGGLLPVAMVMTWRGCLLVRHESRAAGYVFRRIHWLTFIGIHLALTFFLAFPGVSGLAHTIDLGRRNRIRNEFKTHALRAYEHYLKTGQAPGASFFEQEIRAERMVSFREHYWYESRRVGVSFGDSMLTLFAPTGRWGGGAYLILAGRGRTVLAPVGIPFTVRYGGYDVTILNNVLTGERTPACYNHTSQQHVSAPLSQLEDGLLTEAFLAHRLLGVYAYTVRRKDFSYDLDTGCAIPATFERCHDCIGGNCDLYRIRARGRMNTPFIREFDFDCFVLQYGLDEDALTPGGIARRMGVVDAADTDGYAAMLRGERTVISAGWSYSKLCARCGKYHDNSFGEFRMPEVRIVPKSADDVAGIRLLPDRERIEEMIDELFRSIDD